MVSSCARIVRPLEKDKITSKQTHPINTVGCDRFRTCNMKKALIKSD